MFELLKMFLIAQCAYFLFNLDIKKKELASQCPLWISEELEWWNERSESAPRFVQIAALYSELIAISSTGQLYQWRWSDTEPYKHPDVSFCIII
jgi:E3 ubiquitin-protein ligase EDD1